MLEVGTIIGGRLRVDQMLGAGGMGIVVAATHIELGNKVAVKVLRDELASNATIVERFIREARAVVNLKTEHVCRVFDVGRLDNGAPYIVMEMLHGSDLQRAIAQRPLPPALAVDYVMQACVALAEAHAGGIIHRDLKPANLFVTRRPDGGPLVKVLDFGIAKAMDQAGPALTHTTGMMGSPGYMSPEQLQSARDVDVRTDIWALGVTLYQLLSARMPFAAPTITEIAIKVATDPPAPIEVEPELRAVILRCLDKVPDRRYPSAAALAGDLARFASSDGRKAIAALGMPAAGPAPAVHTPALIDVGAVTAASVASSSPSAPVVKRPPTAEPTLVVQRAKWPLALGALALIGATVAVMFVAMRKHAEAPVTPTPGSAIAVATPDAALAAIAPDARTVAADAGDAWATPAIVVDAGMAARDAAADNDEMIEVDPDPATMQMFMSEKDKQHMRDGCKDVVNDDKKYLAVPGMQPNLAICFCALGQVAKAQAMLDATKELNMRNSIRTMCAMGGARLKPPVAP